MQYRRPISISNLLVFAAILFCGCEGKTESEVKESHQKKESNLLFCEIRFRQKNVLGPSDYFEVSLKQVPSSISTFSTSFEKCPLLEFQVTNADERGAEFSISDGDISSTFRTKDGWSSSEIVESSKAGKFLLTVGIHRLSRLAPLVNLEKQTLKHVNAHKILPNQSTSQLPSTYEVLELGKLKLKNPSAIVDFFSNGDCVFLSSLECSEFAPEVMVELESADDRIRLWVSLSQSSVIGNWDSRQTEFVEYKVLAIKQLRKLLGE
ncbi:MAG: hypothetical protein AAF939_21250 [Planctomycetota bacterium]